MKPEFLNLQLYLNGSYVGGNKITESHYLQQHGRRFSACQFLRNGSCKKLLFSYLHICIRFLAQKMAGTQKDCSFQKRSKNNLDCQNDKKIELKLH